MAFVHFRDFSENLEDKKFKKAFALKFNLYDICLARRLPESERLWRFVKANHHKEMINHGLLPKKRTKIDLPKKITLDSVRELSSKVDFGRSKSLTRKIFEALPSSASPTLVKNILAIGGIDLGYLPLSVLNRYDFLFQAWVNEAKPKDNIPLPQITDLLDPLQVYPIRPLGMGAYGAVFVVWVWGYGKCVLKLSNNTQQGYGPEIECLYTSLLQCGHPNVLCAKQCFRRPIGREETENGFFTDYFEGYTDLVKWGECVRSALSTRTKEANVMREIRSLIATIFRQILEAVIFIHSKRIVHRDIKPENVLIKWDVPIIIDFGGAWVPMVTQGEYYGFMTKGYAPTFLEKKYDRDLPMTFDELRWGDFWAVGATLYDVIRLITTGKYVRPNQTRYQDPIKMTEFRKVHDLLTNPRMDLTIGEKAIIELSKIE